MTVFWRKYNELCDERGIKPRTLATELGISAATVTKWVNDGMPNLDMITRIAVRCSDRLSHKRGRYTHYSTGKQEKKRVQVGKLSVSTVG